MKAGERIAVFRALNHELRMILDKDAQTESGKKLADLIDKLHIRNAWFTPANVRHRIAGLAHTLDAGTLTRWLEAYSLPDGFSGKTIGVIAAGNIPAAGADDFFQVLLSGHKYTGKLSGDDNLILPLLAGIIGELDERFKAQIHFTEGRIGEIHAVLATGSNNTSRYFEYYFGKYPHLIRKNRNSIAVLDGRESAADLKALSEDIFRYFGLGCRNVTKVFVPEGYRFDGLFEALFHWSDELMQNRKYMNNYEYNRTIYMLNSEPLLDNNFLVIRKDVGIASPPGVLYHESYASMEEVHNRIRTDRELIQCIVSKLPIEGAVRPGQAQTPEPWEYADGIDTMEFLLKQ